MKDAVDDFVGGIERYLDLAGVGIDGEGLMLGEGGWSEYGSEGEDGEGFHCFSPMVFDYQDLRSATAGPLRLRSGQAFDSVWPKSGPDSAQDDSAFVIRTFETPH